MAVTRLDPDARREALVEAALACLRRDGREGLSARRIGAEAGISIGLINHYFPGLHDLVAAAYEAMADRLLAVLVAAADAAPQGPARLRAFVGAFFGPENLHRDLLRAWIVFWAMALESGAVRAVHDRTNARFQAELRRLLREAGAEPQAQDAALELGALLDGLWVEWGLAAQSLDPARGLSIVGGWIDRYLADQSDHGAGEFSG